MGLRKGQTNNPAGRPAGASNKVTRRLRAEISEYLESEFNTLKKDLKKLEPKDRAQYFIKLLPFALPQLKQIEHTTELKSVLEDMPEEELDLMLLEAVRKAEKTALYEEFNLKLNELNEK